MYLEYLQELAGGAAARDGGHLIEDEWARPSTAPLTEQLPDPAPDPAPDTAAESSEVAEAAPERPSWVGLQVKQVTFG